MSFYRRALVWALLGMTLPAMRFAEQAMSIFASPKSASGARVRASRRSGRSVTVAHAKRQARRRRNIAKHPRGAA